MKNLHKRFIFFNMFIISCVMIIFAILVLFSEHSRISINRMILAIAVSIILVSISSWLLSKIALAPIRAAWQKQLDFTADASHELRTPLSTIQTNLDVVLSNPTATIESQSKWLKNIEIENKRMSALVSDLLLLSRADTNEDIIDMEKLDLSTLVSKMVMAYDVVIREKDLTLTYDIKNEISIQGDKDRIKQLLVILIDNSVKYNTDNGKINIILSKNEHSAVIEISDTGIGIGKEEVTRVFDRFYRGKESRINNPDGSGLGLSIAKLITEEHGGTISAESQPKKGSTFKISIPVLI